GVVSGPDLSVRKLPDVCVIGDTAPSRDEKGQPLPGMAPAAKQMGRYVGKLIATRLKGQSPPPFRYHHPGDLAAIGRRSAVVKLGRIHLKGIIAWLFWALVHIYFLIVLRHRFIVAFTWFW